MRCLHSSYSMTLYMHRYQQKDYFHSHHRSCRHRVTTMSRRVNLHRCIHSWQRCNRMQSILASTNNCHLNSPNNLKVKTRSEIVVKCPRRRKINSSLIDYQYWICDTVHSTWIFVIVAVVAVLSTKVQQKSSFWGVNKELASYKIRRNACIDDDSIAIVHYDCAGTTLVSEWCNTACGFDHHFLHLFQQWSFRFLDVHDFAWIPCLWAALFDYFHLNCGW